MYAQAGLRGRDYRNGRDLDGGIGIVYLAGLEIWRDCGISPHHKHAHTQTDAQGKPTPWSLWRHVKHDNIMPDTSSCYVLCTHTHTRARTHSHTHKSPYTFADNRTHSNTHTRTHTYTYTFAEKHTHTLHIVHILAIIQRPLVTSTDTHTHTHTHTHTDGQTNKKPGAATVGSHLQEYSKTQTVGCWPFRDVQAGQMDLCPGNSAAGRQSG